ncbi:MAG: disulfide bond formation protein B [Solirubrobacterales bacterium]
MIRKIPSHLVALFVLAVSVVALALAFVAEYGFGLKPCILCLTQRVPFAVAGALATLALLSPRFAVRRVLLGAAALGFLINSGIAVYHVGVEQKWWASSCAKAETAIDLTDLAGAMNRPVEVRCDEPAWQWHGITMATLNIFFSGGLALVTLVLVRRMEARK